MAQQLKIDGTNINYIGQAIWTKQPHSQSLDIIAVHDRWQDHLWMANIMAMSEWQTLIGKRGSIVSITTPAPSDPNGDYITYYEAIVIDVFAQAHDARNMSNVKVEFKVRV